ncbi:MAG: HAMP domain-containing histidine kinase, partial [Actinomycetota bacterium]|nr:HAMP domain-containing histidine kinase [Actinomycetota bacterium]
MTRLYPRSLRGRLVAGLLLLLTVGIVAVDLAAVTALRSYLVQRIDEQLIRAAPQIVNRILLAGGPLPPSAGGSAQLAPTDFVIQIVDDTGRVTALVVDAAGLDPDRLPVIDGLTAAEVAGRGGEPFSVAAGNDEAYRAVATPLGSRPGSVVVSIPLAEIASTTRRLLLIEGIASLVVVALMGALALVVVRVGLRPLTDVGGTARAIADGDLSRRVAPAEQGTEIGRLGLALNDMLAQIEGAFHAQQDSEQRLRRFVADASHELRTPLTSIRGYAELQRQGAVRTPEHLARVMARIEAEARRMAALVDDLLLLTRLDQAPPAQHEAVDLTAVIAEAVQDFRAVQPGGHADADLPGSPVHVLGDRRQLEQVLANLMSNARIHASGAAVRVALGGEGGHAVVTVTDDGPGMPTEVAARVFDRFYRADAGRSREHGGAGLGLAIVAAIVAAHAGTVTVETAPGAGTAFTIRLPVVPAAVGHNQEGNGMRGPVRSARQGGVVVPLPD